MKNGYTIAGIEKKNLNEFLTMVKKHEFGNFTIYMTKIFIKKLNILNEILLEIKFIMKIDV